MSTTLALQTLHCVSPLIPSFPRSRDQKASLVASTFRVVADCFIVVAAGASTVRHYGRERRSVGLTGKYANDVSWEGNASKCRCETETIDLQGSVATRSEVVHTVQVPFLSQEFLATYSPKNGSDPATVSVTVSLPIAPAMMSTATHACYLLSSLAGNS